MLGTVANQVHQRLTTGVLGAPEGLALGLQGHLGSLHRSLGHLLQALADVLDQLDAPILVPQDFTKYIPGLLQLKTATTRDDYRKAWLVKSRLGRWRKANKNPARRGANRWVEKIYRNGKLYSTVNWDSMDAFWREVDREAEEQDEGNEQLRTNWKYGPSWASSHYTDGVGNQWRLQFRRA